jgi:uncharacterized protein (TIGR03118 family)
MSNCKNILFAASAFAAALWTAPVFAATNFTMTPLISNVDGAAAVTDPNLVGTWGISLSAASPFWVSNAGNGTSSIYTVSDSTVANFPTLTMPSVSSTLVAIPVSASNKSGKLGTPTGQVNNSYGVGNFETAPGAASSFIFATLDGTISARGGSTAVIFVDNGAKGAVYTGLAIGVATEGPVPGPTLYAANFSQGTIDTWDHTWKSVTLPGGFRDPDLPAGFYPSNIQRYGRRMYVTYNFSDGSGSFAYGGAGTGLVDVFDVNGNLLQRLVPNNQYMNLPWGLAVTGANFGSFSYALVVGNFGDGSISAFDLNTGDYLGTMQDGKGNNISINGLWGLQWGNGGSGGDASTLYFAASPGAGPSGFSQVGLFGALKPMADSTLQ